MCGTPFSCPILMKLEFSRQISGEYSDIEFHNSTSNWSRVVPFGRTDMTKLRVAFRSFANASKSSNVPTVFSESDLEV
jgi:hypothetical protein